MNILSKNLLILASAGSGKTYKLGDRVIGLVARGVPPEKIVALTFTRKAAGEFADSVLTKLAKAASDPQAASHLAGDIAMPGADFPEALETVVRALPRFTLGTMDSFFSRVVRGFQYELGLTGGKFDLLEGPRADAAADELMAEILGAALDEETGEEFFHAFRRATIGREELGVLRGLREFVKSWQETYGAGKDLEWGPAALAAVAVEDWEKHKHALAEKVRRHLAGTTYTDKRQPDALEKALDCLTGHTIGCGSLGSPGALVKCLFEAVGGPAGPLDLKHYKPFTVGGPAAEALRELVMLAAECEMAAAVSRTRALREVMAVYDRLRETRLRRRGLLDFSDVKALMGQWAGNEDARLRREMVDFRLDARHEHWLLDEFQDTSRADWTGLLPLIDEAAAEGGDGSVFIVGDRKQAIYAWRGGQVALFDEVMARYGSGLKVEPMADSWRSCPEVLALVNDVCGDTGCLTELFGDAASAWQWQEHVSAKPLAAPDKCGEARVEVVEGGREGRLGRLVEILAEVEIGRRVMTCGVLVRSNKDVREVADHLREHGFDVIEEGRREPAKDNPVGIAMAHLLRWLANPADGFAGEVLAMSPLAGLFRGRFGEHWQQAWDGLTARISAVGFAGMMEEAVEPLSHGWSEFGRRRAGDIIAALAQLDASGGASPAEAADWIDRLEVGQSPGAAAVQVMTIHKSKGLGFDVVVLPEVPDETIPGPQHFTVARGEGWICQTPPLWARELIPEMREAEKRWSAGQQYEAFCALYVALTRAKRGLYVLLDEPSSSRDPLKRSLANWMAVSLGSEGSPGVIYQRGSAGWHAGFPLLGKAPRPADPPAAGAAVPRRERSAPSASKAPAAAVHTGVHFGRAVHAAFETVGWIDESPPDLAPGAVGDAVAAVLAAPGCRELFLRAGRRVDLLVEQPVEAISEGKWLSGIIDRLHIFRDESGRAVRLEIIDFKTDAAEPDELAARHGHQMRAYLDAMSTAFPGAEVEGFLISTRHRCKIAI